MIRKVFKTGNSLVIALPKEELQSLGLQAGSEVEVAVNQEDNTITITPAKQPIADIDETFAQQLNDFIEQYRPALEALAK